jgi:hypothetical protein
MSVSVSFMHHNETKDDGAWKFYGICAASGIVCFACGFLVSELTRRRQQRIAEANEFLTFYRPESRTSPPGGRSLRRQTSPPPPGGGGAVEPIRIQMLA